MTLQNLQNETEEEIEKILKNPPTWTDGDSRTQTERIYDWHKSQLEKAYQAGREDMSNELEQEVENQIAREIIIAHNEGTLTSRLTSFSNKFSEIIKKYKD